MSKSTVITLSFLTFLAAAILVVVGAYVSAYNYGNRTEKLLEAVYVNNQNVLAGYSLKVQEAAQIPAMYKDDLKEVVTSALSGRYGANGSQAIVQWIQEAQIPFDSSLYVKLQQIIVSGRNEFKNEQTRMIDVKRGYETSLGSLWAGFWLDVAGYPKIDLTKYQPVLAEDTAEIFERGKMAPIKLR